MVGLDEPRTGMPDADRAFRGASLHLCGHTHGGQVALPWGSIIVPGPVGKELRAGFHDAYGTQVFVSRAPRSPSSRSRREGRAS